MLDKGVLCSGLIAGKSNKHNISNLSALQVSCVAQHIAKAWCNVSARLPLPLTHTHVSMYVCMHTCAHDQVHTWQGREVVHMTNEARYKYLRHAAHSQGTAEEQMLNLGSTRPDPSSRPESTTPAADAVSNYEYSVHTTGSTLPHVASRAISPTSSHMHGSPVGDGHATSHHCTALPQDSPAPGECTEQDGGRQVAPVDEAIAEALHGPATGPEPGQVQQPSGQLGHVAVAVKAQEQAGVVKASRGVLQVPGPLHSPSGQQRAVGFTGSVRDGVDNAAQGVLQGSGGQQRGGPAVPPGETGVVNAAQGRERTEAARRGTRNSLLLSLHRVAVTDLPRFQDLPIESEPACLVLTGSRASSQSSARHKQ